MRLSRRSLIRTGLLAATAPALGRLGLPLVDSAQAQTAEWRHGLTLFDDVKYPADFKHFDYVNPNAPKGGAVRMIAPGSFDNFNVAVGVVRGSIAMGLNWVVETLTTSSLDEAATDYGLIAEAISYPADFSSVAYRLRAAARWHDGKPITAEDLIFSFETAKKYDPQLGAYYKHVVKAEKTGDREVTFTFDAPGNRELPQIIGQLNLLPKHWWEGTDAAGKKRDVGATTLEPVLGSGPYRIKSFVAGRSVVFERVKDYWAKDLGVTAGQNNFDELRFEYFRDPTVALEAFKGDQVDWRTEQSAKSWATAYDFPAITEKRVVLEEFPISNVGVMQAFVLNLRRDKFKDARLRRAFDFVYDFEEMNKQLFYGQYHRVKSYFDGTELASSGLPEGMELEILETVRDKVSTEVFTTAYTNPVGGSPAAARANLREAIRLVRQAGYDLRDRRLVNTKTGEQMGAEILCKDPNDERLALFYKPSLEQLGVAVTIRTVDDAQFENRLRTWDYDIMMNLWPQSLSPGNEQRDFWGSQAADEPGSRNYIGIKNPAVDALIERVIYAKHRDELLAASRALDRVLLWNHYLVPQFTYDKTRTARWDRFGKPELMPKYGMSAFPTVWWWDEARAAKTGSRR